MFALGIRYLRGVSVATTVGNYQHAEWPPHPARVFMAMAAAHFETGGDAEERAALEWLESVEEAPRIRASEADRRDVAIRFVPVNDRPGPSKAILQSAPGLTRDRAARSFPTVRPVDDMVFLIWSVDCPAAHVLAIERVCGKVARIGHSSSFVQMWLEGNPPDPTWIPEDEAATLRVRRITPGLLRYLEECANGERVEEYATLQAAMAGARGRRRKQLREEIEARFPEGQPVPLRPTVSVWQGYALEGTTSRPVVPSSIWEREFIALRLEPLDGSARHLDAVATLALTRRLHEAVLSQCPTPIPEYVSGHRGDSPSERPHLAYFPLVFVDARHADGLIRGLGVALPRGLAPAERRIALAAVSGVRELLMGPLGRWALTPEIGDPPPVTMTPWSWAAGHEGERTWATVTPIVFDRHPKARDRTEYEQQIEEVIASACRSIGLPSPASVVVTPASAHVGAPAAHEFPRMERKDGSRRRHVHTIVVFPERVTGPVLLGAGRYRGYGLCQPLREVSRR